MNSLKTIYKFFFLALYLSFFRFLPASSTPFIGRFFRTLRYLCCKPIFKSCGRNVNIERMAFFGSGFNLTIGDNSGLGINSVVPGNTIIGKNVMMGPNVYILSSNHQFDRTDIPMIEQGNTTQKQCIIEDDVWIGRQVIFTPGRTVKKGSIIGAGTLLCKNFEAYSIIGGNPSILIRSRLT
ncbi:Galactoside O-acetyltransferase [compost metagenome]